MPQNPCTRWCPTPEQLMILEQLYRGEIRTPNASQIQQITAHLALYGKIEGKNVFYWFQNHKARDRQKLRRRLSRQHKIFQQHQQLACSFLQAESAEASAFCLTNQNPSQFLHQVKKGPAEGNPRSPYPEGHRKWQGGDQGCAAMEETAQVMNLLCKLETSDKELESMGKHHASSSTPSPGHGSNWMMMMAMTNTVEEELPYYSPCTNRPLKTLELFPTTSSGDLLKEENKISSSFT